MLMPTNSFKQAIASGKPQIGLWISLCSPIAAEVVASAGYDWVLLDMEHSPNELPTVLGQLQAFQQYGSTSIVRPPVLQLETRHALSQAREIAAIDGVDGIFFGAADIAADFGLVGQPEAAEVWEAISEAAQVVREVGKPVGTLVTNPAKAIELLNSGFSFVACGIDAGLLARGADSLLQSVRDGIV